MGLRVSIGVARNRLLAKLSSGAAKLGPSPSARVPQQQQQKGEGQKQGKLPRQGGGRLLVVGDDDYGCSGGADEEVGSLLGRLPARKVPGLGEKARELEAMGADSISSLQVGQHST